MASFIRSSFRLLNTSIALSNLCPGGFVERVGLHSVTHVIDTTVIQMQMAVEAIRKSENNVSVDTLVFSHLPKMRG